MDQRKEIVRKYLIWEGGVNFGSQYLRNRLSYRPLVGPNGSGTKNTLLMGYLASSKNFT